MRTHTHFHCMLAFLISLSRGGSDVEGVMKTSSSTTNGAIAIVKGWRGARRRRRSSRQGDKWSDGDATESYPYRG